MVSRVPKLIHYHWLCAIIFVLIVVPTYGGRHSFRQLCITEGQQRGRCVPVKQCDSVLTTLRKETHTHEDIQYLYGSECGRTAEGKALVCCPQSSLIPVGGSEAIEPARINSTIRVNGEEKPPTETTVETVPRTCGMQSAVKLTNHTIGHHPWTVLLHYGSQAHDTNFNCSGTLIAPEYVLTSASCVDDGEAWKNLTVRLGEWDLESTVDCILSPESDDLVCADPSYDVPVVQVILHEAYTGRRNDIALLKLAQPAQLNDWITPICLPASPVLNETVTYSVAGWNQNTCEDPSSRFKLLSSYNVLNQTACQRYVPSVAGTSYGFVCVATGEQPLGDAGGGLTAAKTIDPDQRPVYELIGVLSSMSSCANYDGVAVYTRVTQYMDWIESKLELQGGA
uniref:CLIP domain-containing serine protease n=1 Tax=Anopheles christyi TaxID=43041 RepID=A0A182JNT1_9DIPT